MDLNDIRQRYLELQQALHPDRFVRKDQEEEKIRAEAASSLVNKAYHTLKNPLSRAVYMVIGWVPVVGWLNLLGCRHSSNKAASARGRALRRKPQAQHG